ncbi:winged helix-turn-helix domain-containing protein [Candidatus Bathyarchaeota archaeon]|nr:winged helix-turn-helix domain-containing protein [Candidatus Bathyarchaeota archaeon]
MSLDEVFSSKIKIIQTLRRAGKPLIAQHIAKRSRLSPQLVSYHIGQMVEWGIITASSFEDKTVYQLQKAYLDEQLLEDLSALLILYMQKMSKNMDFSQIKGSTTEAVIRNLFLFIRLFETEIEKLPLNRN